MLTSALFLVATALSASAPPKHPLTLEQAVHQVKQDTDGHVLSADTVRSGRSNKYRIKVLTSDGRVRVVEVDSNAKKVASTGDERSKSRNKETH
ncbi:MAG TPA: hypothetical protein VFN09_03620 [Rhodanobacteraceae bacterium]|nr:hypothetical protein [Rhodanobacteraceae bacterium]